MKIAFVSLKGNSGSDVYYNLLKNALNKYSFIKSEIFYFPSFLEKIPFLIPMYLKKINFDDYDIIHTNAEFGHYFKIAGKKLVITIHHSVFDKNYQKYTSLFQKIFHYLWIKPNLRKSLNVADNIIAVSNYTKTSILDYFKLDKEVYVIHNGIDTNKFKPMKIKINDKRFKLLFVGNLTERKGVDLLPKIMKELEEKEFVLFYTSGLRTQIPEDFNLSNMIPLGRLSEEDLIKEYNKCNSLLFPTRLEGFGYAVAEAMACGKPVISTNCSSIPEIVENGKNGFLCKIDDVDDFVEKIKILKKDKRLRENMGLKNKEKVIKKFSIHKMGERYIELYKKMV